MIAVLIGCLIVLNIYLAKRWNDSSTESTQLRAQVATLRRQLKH